MWLRYIDDIFFVWLEGEDKLSEFMKKLNEIHPSLTFTYEYKQTKVNFLDVMVEIDAGQFFKSLLGISLLIAINIYIMSHRILPKSKDLSYIVRVYASRKFVRVKRILKTKHLQELFCWLKNLVYPRLLIEKDIYRVKEYNIEESNRSKEKIVRQECL